MANNEQSTFKLDLDNKGFIAGTEEAIKKIRELGDPESLMGLMSTMRNMLAPMAAVTAAVYGFKQIFDFTIEGEELNKINAQFEDMAKNVGLVGSEFRDKLMSATAGLVDETDALKTATQMMVLLGEKSGKLPEVFELARKAVALYGGEFSDRVQQISRAYETGNTRVLQTIGVHIDADKILKKYAESVRLTKDELSPYVQKHVLANAVLEETRKKFEGVNTSITPIHNALTQFKIAWNDIGETVAVATNKMFGPTFKRLIQDAANSMRGFALTLKEWLGSGADEASAKMDKLRLKIEAIEQDIASARAREGLLGKLLPQSAIDSTVARLEEMKAKVVAELKDLEAKTKPTGAAETKETAPKGKSEEEIQMQQEILAAQQASNAERLRLVSEVREAEYSASQYTTKEEEAKQAYIVALKEEEAAKIAQLNIGMSNEASNAKEKELLIHAQTQNKIQSITKQSANNQKRTYQELVNSMNGAQQLLTVSMVAGFKNLSKGGKEAAKAMKAAFLNMLADRAEGEGQLKIASGIFPPNPGLLASGAALLAIGGALRSAAGGAEASAVSAGGGGGGGGYVAPPPTVDVSQRPDLQTAQQAASRQRSVTIAIAGNYFETAETRRALMEMIRSETDATAFQYVQIPQGTA